MGTSTRYKDGLFKVIASITGAYFVTEFEGEDGYFSAARFQSAEFYIEFGSSLIIALVLVWMISWITRLLDQHLDWRQKTVRRIGLQLLLGIALPAIIDFAMASIYFRIFGMNILDTSYLLHAMPYIVSMIALFNVCYSFYLTVIKTERRTLDLEIITEPSPKGARERSEPGEEKKQLKEIFIARSGEKNIAVPVEDICCIFRQSEYCLLLTFKKDTSLVRQSLDELQHVLSKKQFFRLNRKIIINYKAVYSFEPVGRGRIKVFLEPAAPAGVPTVVSQNKAGSFKDWIDR